MPALSFSVIGQKQQLSAAHSNRSEENKTVILWRLLHDGTSAKTKNLPLRPACPECRFALIGAQRRDEGRKTEREREELGEKKQGRGRKEN